MLAGGASRRMGVDKARVHYGGRPLALATAESMLEVCDRVALVRRAPADGLPWRDRWGEPVEVIWDAPNDAAPTEGRHPLWGVHAALLAARTAMVLVVACDVPGLSPTSLGKLIEARGVARAGGRRHPLVAVLDRTWAERAARVARDGGTAHAFTADLPAVELPAAELENLNHPEQVSSQRRPRWATIEGPTPTVGLARRALGEARRLAARGILDPGVLAAVSSSGTGWGDPEEER